jgi:anion-transporting  ArsA/GET3 family ATPase
MTSEAQDVDSSLFASAGVSVRGNLTVMMLDTKRTFDELVARFASSAEARDRILNNRLYQHLSTNLAGTQDYMAMEKLLLVKDDAAYDLIILDTPPTRNALDFLEAPDRLIQALDGAAVRWFLQAFDKSRTISLNLVAQSVAVVLRGIGKITGSGFLEQMAGLIVDLNDLFGGFKERATRVSQAFRGPEFGYVMVTSPAPLAVDEVIYFADRLRAQGIRSDAFVVNRLHRHPPAVPTEAQIQAAIGAHGLALGAGAAERVRRAVDDEVALAALDRGHVGRLAQAVAPRAGTPSPTLIRIPALPSDVHDISTLEGISTVLCPETA